MSKAEYINNFWIRNLQNKLDYCSRNMGRPENRERIESNFRLIINELTREQNNNRQIEPGVNLDKISVTDLNPEFIELAHDYLDRLNRFYIALYNRANQEKDNIISGYHRTEEGRQQFLDRKNSHHNEALSDLVRNSREVTRVVEYNEELHQRIDPVYRDPDGRFIKAHFYAPEKRLFGGTYNTLWVNIIVMWMMTILLFIALYFRLLNKGLEKLEDTIDLLKEKITRRT